MPGTRNSGHRGGWGELRYRAVPQAAPASGRAGSLAFRLSPVSPTEASTGPGINVGRKPKGGLRPSWAVGAYSLAVDDRRL